MFYNKKKAFISHSSKDKPIARKVAEQLRQMGWKVWIDEGELKPGDSLAEKLSSAISEVDIFVIILTNNSISSNWVKYELNNFIPTLVESNKQIVPLLFDKVQLPVNLRGYLYADCTGDRDISIPISPALASFSIKPITKPKELQNRLKSKVIPKFCVRLIPSLEFKDNMLLGKENRKYVAIGDYYENYGKSLREVLDNLYQGYYLDEIINANQSWSAIIFEVGELYRSMCDIMPATWKSVFRILTDKRRLGILEPTISDYQIMGKPPRDYYAGNQSEWQEKIRMYLGGYPNDEEVLKNLFGIISMCFQGTGIGPNGHRIFFAKNIAVEKLNFMVKDLGKYDDGILLK